MHFAEKTSLHTPSVIKYNKCKVWPMAMALAGSQPVSVASGLKKLEVSAALLLHSSSHSCQEFDFRTAIFLRKACETSLCSHYQDEELRSRGGHPPHPPFPGSTSCCARLRDQDPGPPLAYAQGPIPACCYVFDCSSTIIQLQRELWAGVTQDTVMPMLYHTQPPPRQPPGSPDVFFPPFQPPWGASSLLPALHGEPVYFCGAGNRTQALPHAR